MSFSDIATYILFISVFFIAFTQVYLTSFRQLQIQETQLVESKVLLEDIKNTKIQTNLTRYNANTQTMTLRFQNGGKQTLNPIDFDIYANGVLLQRYPQKWEACTKQSTIGCGELGWGDSVIETTYLQALYHMNNDSNYGESNTALRDFASTVQTRNFGATLSIGKFEYAYEFDGNANITTAVSPSHNFNGSAGLFAWVYPTNLGTDQTILAKGNAYQLWIDSEENIILSSPTTNYNTSTKIQQNQWSLIIATITNPNIEINLNGNTILAQANDASFSVDTTSNISIGFGSRGGFFGKIDEVAIYSNPALLRANYQTLYYKGFQSLNPSLWDMDEFAQITIPISSEYANAYIQLKHKSGIQTTGVLS